MNTGKSQNIIGKFIDVIFKEKNLGISLAPPRTVDGKGAMVTSIAEKDTSTWMKYQHHVMWQRIAASLKLGYKDKIDSFNLFFTSNRIEFLFDLRVYPQKPLVLIIQYP